MSKQVPLNIGVIGTGGMGARHARNLHEQVPAAQVAAVYDLDAARAGQVAEHCGGAQVFADPLALIASGAVDALVIASPDHTHVELALACLRAGKPVLCEKPLATSALDAMRVVEAEQALGRRLVSVGYMRRFDPQHLAVRQALAAGAIGRALLFKGVHRNAHTWPEATGEDVLNSSASHDIDSARWLLGQEVAEVFVQGLRTRESLHRAAADLQLLQLRFAGGALATIEVYVAAEYGYEVSAELVGERGTATTLPHGHALVRAQGASAVAVPPDWLARFQEAYVAEAAAWVASLRGGALFAGASAWDGAMAQLAVEACVRSLRGGAPVRVDAPARPALYGERDRAASLTV